MPDRSVIGELGRFGLVGLSATAVHYLTALSVASLWSPYLANLTGYLAAVTLSYLGHHHFTFRHRTAAGNHRRQAPRFLVVSLVALALSQGALALARSATMPVWSALLVAVMVVPLATFVAGRVWVFRAQGDAERRASHPR